MSRNVMVFFYVLRNVNVCGPRTSKEGVTFIMSRNIISFSYPVTSVPVP